MCTIGAITLGDGEYALFKNKDFARPNFADRVVVNEDWFGPLGLETFADDPNTPNVYSGVSIGANRQGLLCCVNHVKITAESSFNYDLLTQVALSDGQDVSSAIDVIRRAIEKRPFWWGNLILADNQQLAAVEVRDRQIRTEFSLERIFRTNHQPLFGEARSNDGVACSASRFTSAMERLPDVTTLDDIFALLATHDAGHTGICNHTEQLTTVYSYVLHHKDEDTTFYVAHGNPCTNDWQASLVPIGENWSQNASDEFMRWYPGAYGHTPVTLSARAAF